MKLSRINDPSDLEIVTPVEVPDHPGYYYFPDDNRVMVSRDGQVLNLYTSLPRKLKISKKGFYTVGIFDNISNKKLYYSLHRIIARTFIGRPSRHLDKDFQELEVNHIDGIRSNNSIENLEWCTHRENVRHSTDNGLIISSLPVEAYNPLTGDKIFFNSINQCDNFFDFPNSTLNKHLMGKDSGRVKRNGYIFRFKENDSDWDVNINDYLKYRDFLNHKLVYRCFKLYDNYDFNIFSNLETLAKYLATSTVKISKKLKENNPFILKGHSITSVMRKDHTMTTSPVYERATSAFPFSVGTSLAMESLFIGPNTPIDPERKIPQHVDIKDYNELWINVGCLFRNLYTAIPRDRVHDTVSRDCVDALADEMSQIHELVNEESQGKTRVIYYICSYRGLEQEFKGAVRRTPNTDKQKFYQKLMDETLNRLVRRVKETQELLIREFNVTFYPDERIKALIITHYAVDLLSAKRFRSLDLLESHTGVLKKFNTWYTKYYNGKELMMIPFNEYLIKFFGDNDLIVPFHFKVRRVIQEVAEQHKWNYATSMSKVRADIGTIKDHFARKEILKML